MLPKDLTTDIKTRLTTIRGQVDGLVKMLDNEADPEKIITQFKAVNSGLDTAYNLLLDEVYRKALAIKIVEVADVSQTDGIVKDTVVFATKTATVTFDESKISSRQVIATIDNIGFTAKTKK